MYLILHVRFSDIEYRQVKVLDMYNKLHDLYLSLNLSLMSINSRCCKGIEIVALDTLVRLG